jgi:hypothetical protein
MSNWSATVDRYLAEGRTVSGGKGDQTAKAAENQQMAFTAQLMKTFQAQFSNQQGVLSYLQNTLKPQIAAPQGYDPATLAALKTNAINRNAENYQNALKGVQANMSTKGGPTSLPSGVEEQIRAQLAGQEAQGQSDALTQIQESDAGLKQQNYWNSVNALNGVSAQFNPLGYAGEANGGSSAISGLSEAFTQSNQSQLLGALGGIAGGVGTALSGRMGH